ncbi:MAG: GNAT family N-acetyltransferase [Dehalococcoidia bacterium]
MANDHGPGGQNADDAAPRRPWSLDSCGLELVSMTIGFLETMLDRQGQPDIEFDGVRMWEDWTASDRPDIAFRLAQLRAMPELLPWLMYAIVKRSDKQMVGTVGFHGAPGLHSLGDPAPDALEIGYSVFPPFRRNGYAVAASKALIQWANTDCGITYFVASISHDNIASQGVAAKVGFKFYRDFDPADPEREDIYTMRLGPDKN